MQLFNRHERTPVAIPQIQDRPGYLIIDTETTGFSPGKDRLLEIGMVWLDDEFRTKAEYTSLFHIDTKVRATHIHGITDQMLAGIPPFKRVAKWIAREAMTNVLVGHNIAFDLRFLVNEMRLAGVDHFQPVATGDTLEWARSILQDKEDKFTLTRCCEHYEIPYEIRHSALADARVTAKLMPLLLRDTDFVNMSDVETAWAQMAPRHKPAYQGFVKPVRYRKIPEIRWPKK